MTRLPVRKLDSNAVLPSRGSSRSAGLDLSACERVILKSRGFATVRTGIAVAIPEGCVGLVWPRSGISARAGIGTLAGVIDNDYRGEIKVVLFNHGERDFEVRPGDRVAQLIIQKCEFPEPVEIDSLDETERGFAGFGSTGR